MLICKKHTTWQVLYYGDYMNPEMIKTNFKEDRHLTSGVKIATNFPGRAVTFREATVSNLSYQ